MTGRKCPGCGRIARALDRTLPQLSLHSPIGDLTISEEEGEIVSLDWDWGRDQTPTPLLLRAKNALLDYFDGAALEALPLNPRGSAYRQRVWQALREIPAGQTRSYIEIARTAGGCARSVGSANRVNPIAIFIPCHRVVGASGIGGYSGGDGLITKRKLLALEQGGRI
jgi:methylated-DNA-[protein]-cysteine S-methyltransferase